MKSNINVILLGILVFLLGSVAGATGYCLYCKYYPPKPPDFIQILAKEIKLDTKQQEQARIIIGETRQRVIALNRQMPHWENTNQDYKPQWEAIRQDSDQRIRNILRDDQKILFEQFLNRRVKRPQVQSNPK
jgi:hypothetical protein